MHDTESDTIAYETWPEKVSHMLKAIGIDSFTKERGADSVEIGDYSSRLFSQTPRMVTNLGVVELKNSNIDVIQVIQKG
ncbi:hypothetical protein [Candidatus Nitrosotenuis cloacae]|uniref:Uncharacterized protein n=1 Tax=Candidatus Nitrosotenuis cloacae TaxID=1603555 RepID=A0A3G1B5K1_9ARCH|nr:hypothetical protein [Candidatus Nitrosotenuis cloacae]AJZ75197.1 hypothetical protein SU86_001005 [Candidatus Nitrosotenuis cloacae]